MKNLFKTYHQFSKISGIELNTTKTEILRIGVEHDEREYIIVDTEGQEIPIKSIKKQSKCVEYNILQVHCGGNIDGTLF